MESIHTSERADSLLARAIRGDEVAFARIVAAYHSDMARVCHVICGDAQLSQDAVQAAWPRVWAKIGTVRDPQKLRPWLIAVAANEARRLRSQRGKRHVHEISIDAPLAQARYGHDRDPAEREQLIDLANLLSRMSDRDRTIVGMRYAAGMSSAEIGVAIGMSAGGVRARIAHLIELMRTELGND